MACEDTTPEVNSIAYPGTPECPKFDTVQNWPPTTEVTQTTGEDITRNRDALLTLERILGPNPHIGLFTDNLQTASVAQRISILEQNLAEGSLELKRLRVTRAIDVIRDLNNNLTLALGATVTDTQNATTVEVRGPLRVLDPGNDPTGSRAIFEVGFEVSKTKESGNSTNSLIAGSSKRDQPLLTIQDFNRTQIPDSNHLALRVDGNLEVTGFIEGNFAIDHSRLNNIQTDPVIDSLGNVIRDAIHVTRGNFHSHRRGEFDVTLGRWIVDSNPKEATFGIIDHNDLEPNSIRTSVRQRNFIPNPNLAYHVTNGDDHDHTGGDGAPIRHAFLLGIDPKTSNHVTNGDFHTHNPDLGDGGLIPTHGIILQAGEIDNVSNYFTKDTSAENPDQPNLTELLTTGLNETIGNLLAKDTEQDGRLDSIDTAIEELQLLEGRFDNLENKFLNLEGELVNLEGDVITLQGDVNDIETNISTIETNVSTNTSTISTLQSTINAIGGQKAFKKENGTSGDPVEIALEPDNQSRYLVTVRADSAQVAVAIVWREDGIWAVTDIATDPDLTIQMDGDTLEVFETLAGNPDLSVRVTVLQEP